ILSRRSREAAEGGEGSQDMTLPRIWRSFALFGAQDDGCHKKTRRVVPDGFRLQPVKSSQNVSRAPRRNTRGDWISVIRLPARVGRRVASYSSFRLLVPRRVLRCRIVWLLRTLNASTDSVKPTRDMKRMSLARRASTSNGFLWRCVVVSGTTRTCFVPSDVEPRCTQGIP